jgi:uncharacterized repeat protein (TIGR03803 family)
MKHMNSSRTPLALAMLAAVLLAITIPARAQTFTTLATFNSTTGEYPGTPLVQGLDGNLYGTTFDYGAYGGGTFFQLTLAGTINPLYNFCYNDNSGCPDGAYPQGTIALGTDGNFYGVTEGGFYASAGQGTVYKVTPAGSMTVLHSFCMATCTDGAYPTLGLTMSRSGDFYGLSNAPEDSENFYGQVFKISASGTFHNVLTVCPGTLCPADAGPIGSLLLSSGGALVGPGPSAGYNSSPGALYSMTPSGVPTVVYNFCDDSTCHDGGGYMRTPVAQSASGQIYGTFVQGGAGAYCTQSGGCGTAFRVTPTGVFTKLHDFCSQAGCADGFNASPLLLASDGNYYGTTGEGGAHGKGVLFRIASSGRFSVVHSFAPTDVYPPNPVSLMQATDGNLYGITSQTVFRLSIGLAPFVKTVLNSGAPGSTVTILGNNLTGSTAVTFNGTAAAFTVVSATEITATVPSGATTGSIRVVTPTSTLNSNVAFQVLP